MNSRLTRAPLRSKLRLVVLATCVVSLLVAYAILFGVQFYLFRSEFLQHVAAHTEIAAKAIAPAAALGDSAATETVLAENLLRCDVQSARLLLKDGTEFAKYHETAHDFRQFPRSGNAASAWKGSDFIQSHPILQNQEQIGTLFVVADYGAHARSFIALYVGIFCGLVAITVMVGLLISNRFEHLIADPLKQLANTVRRIATSADYSVRAEKFTDDEVGAFIDAFNQMLEQIQSREATLRHEIAERERAERELQVIHTQFLDTSRQAGMAEVATGVLHNVGNVLNSVNVSATIISEKLNPTRLNNLVRTTQLLQEKGAELGEFLTSDSKGRMVPAYLAELAHHLVRQRGDAIGELDLLMKNIEHIKEIVSMQQNYARVTGHTEPMPPETLVEDALRMTTANLQRSGIEVIRKYESKDSILAERHKVLQILVNLIRNAQHAITEARPEKKQLTVRIHHAGPRTLAITVSDNGIGIPPENLTRIFSHGFTTRKDGHGFGLHSAALSAQQMGGCIVAHSDGPGRGASFSLELPLGQMEVAA
jgi:two-component system, NtrC family, sensor kinase